MAPRKKPVPEQPTNNVPKIIRAKGGLTQGVLLDSVLLEMEEEITRKQGQDFVRTLKALVEEEISQGRPVNVFGIVRIVPRFHTSGERTVLKEFGNPQSGKVKKRVKSRVSLATGQGIFSKSVRDALPTPTKLKNLIGA